MKVGGFDWDAGNREKCRKHGVSLAEIEYVLSHEPRVAPDLMHSTIETRYIGVGRTRENRLLFVAFTLRRRDGTTHLRPISARYMHRKEAEGYERDGA